MCLHGPTPTPMLRQIQNGLCGGVHTAQRPMTTRIPISFWFLVIGVCLMAYSYCMEAGPGQVEVTGSEQWDTRD